MGKTNNYKTIQPVGEHFRDLPVPEAFTWESGIPIGLKGLYVVAFYSKRNLAAGPEKIQTLLALDNGAFEEAQLLEGFGTYWHDDKLSEDGVGLSFCLWESQVFAKNAAAWPNHLAAVRYVMGEGNDVYEEYRVIKNHVDRTEEEIRFTPA